MNAVAPLSSLLFGRLPPPSLPLLFAPCPLSPLPNLRHHTLPPTIPKVSIEVLLASLKAGESDERALSGEEKEALRRIGKGRGRRGPGIAQRVAEAALGVALHRALASAGAAGERARGRAGRVGGGGAGGAGGEGGEGKGKGAPRLAGSERALCAAINAMTAAVQCLPPDAGVAVMACAATGMTAATAARRRFAGRKRKR